MVLVYNSGCFALPMAVVSHFIRCSLTVLSRWWTAITVLFLATVVATRIALILRVFLNNLSPTLTARKGDLSTLLAPLLPLVPIFAPREFRECLMQPVMAMHTEMPATCFGLIATTATALI